MQVLYTWKNLTEKKNQSTTSPPLTAVWQKMCSGTTLNTYEYKINTIFRDVVV